VIYWLYTIRNALSLKKIKDKSISIFSQKFSPVANGEEEEDDDDDDEEESHDVTVVDTEEVNVHDKLICDYMCFIHCFMHVKWVQNPVLQRHQYDCTAPAKMNYACVFLYFDTICNVALKNHPRNI